MGILPDGCVKPPDQTRTGQHGRFVVTVHVRVSTANPCTNTILVLGPTCLYCNEECFNRPGNEANTQCSGYNNYKALDIVSCSCFHLFYLIQIIFLFYAMLLHCSPFRLARPLRPSRRPRSLTTHLRLSRDHPQPR